MCAPFVLAVHVCKYSQHCQVLVGWLHNTASAAALGSPLERPALSCTEQRAAALAAEPIGGTASDAAHCGTTAGVVLVDVNGQILPPGRPAKQVVHIFIVPYALMAYPHMWSRLLQICSHTATMVLLPASLLLNSLHAAQWTASSECTCRILNMQPPIKHASPPVPAHL